MSKVKCAFCVNYKGGKCIEKYVSVSPNKSRKCGMFVVDSSSIKEIAPTPPTMRGTHSVIAKELRYKARKRMKAVAAGLEKDKQNLEDKRELLGPRIDNTKHPLTGDLSRFTTTASPS